MVVVNITGGSTNAVLHLIAMADAVGVKLDIEDFQSVSDRIPFLADLKPSGKYVMADLHNIGGTPSLLKFLLKEGVIDGSGMTVTGETLAKNLEKVPDFPDDQKIIQPMSSPIKETGHIQILRGSLAPGGSVGKITGKEGTSFTGKTRVFDEEDDFIAALERNEIKKEDKTVVVIRYTGPKGGPGMPGTSPHSPFYTLYVGQVTNGKRNAQTLFRPHGCWPRKLLRPNHRRPILRRFPRLPDRPYRPRSCRRRAHRPGQGRRDLKTDSSFRSH